MMATGANADTRSLKLYNLHTHEKSEIVYKRNGRYDQAGLKKINVFLRDWRRNEPTTMDPRLLDLVWDAYRATGSREYIQVICGYRAPNTNSMLRSRSKGVAKNSQHTLGKAMDFYIPGVPLKKLRDIGLKMQGGGVGYYPTSGSPFVHMDVGNVRHWPGISRQELVQLFPDGKTLHVPSDGRPLPGLRTGAGRLQVAQEQRQYGDRAGQHRQFRQVRRPVRHSLRRRRRRGGRHRRCGVVDACAEAQGGEGRAGGEKPAWHRHRGA